MSLWAFFYDPFTQGRRHLVDIAAIHIQLVSNLVIGYVQSHKIQTQHPHFQGLMMARKNGVCQIIKACIAVFTFITLTCQFLLIKAALHDMFGLTRGTLYAFWPAQLTYRLITLTIIDQILDIDLQRWTPGMGWEMGCHSLQHPQIHDPGIQHEPIAFEFPILILPALEGGVVDRHSTPLHEFFHMTIAQRVSNVPPHTDQDHVL